MRRTAILWMVVCAAAVSFAQVKTEIPGKAEPPKAEKIGPPAMRIRVSQAEAERYLDKKVDPIYPEMARTARIQGEVVLAEIIGQDGKVVSVKVISGHPLLVPAAVDAVKQWRYKPYMYNGKPAELETQVRVKFTAPRPARRD